MLYIKSGAQKWGEVLYTVNGNRVYDRYNNFVYEIRGDRIYSSDGFSLKFFISGNGIYDNDDPFAVKYSIHGDRIVEGGQSWGETLYNIDDKF